MACSVTAQVMTVLLRTLSTSVGEPLSFSTARIAFWSGKAPGASPSRLMRPAFSPGDGCSIRVQKAFFTELTCRVLPLESRWGRRGRLRTWRPTGAVAIFIPVIRPIDGCYFQRSRVGSAGCLDLAAGRAEPGFCSGRATKTRAAENQRSSARIGELPHRESYAMLES
jgi:hypothetical protein